MIEQFLAATWVVFAGLCWIMAKAKGRNPWLWLALGIVFGPLGMFALVLMPRRTDEQAPRPEAQ